MTLKCVAANAFWPGKRLAEAGLIDSEACPLCDCGKDDTIFHRAWECQHPDVVEARRRHAGQDLIRQALEAGPSSALFTRALAEHPCHRMPQVLPQQMRFTYNSHELTDQKDWKLEGNVYYDGSCIRAHCTELSRAAFAVVQMNGQEVVAKLQGTVPPNMPQTSQAEQRSVQGAQSR